MILDGQLLFSDGQAVTATAASTNYVDFGENRDMGVGEELYFVCNCTVAMTDSGSDSTLAVTLETDDNTSFSTATTAQTVGTFAALAAAGTRFVARLQPDKINERYLRVKYTTANGDLTTGSFDAFLTKNIQAYTSYAAGYSIS